MKIKTQLVFIGVALFLIGLSLDFMFNLLAESSKVKDWHKANSTVGFVISGILVLAGITLTIISITKKDRTKIETKGSESDDIVLANEDTNFLRERLARHQENRRQLLKQKSIYAVGEEPLHLLNQIAAEEKAINEIEQQLRK